MTDFFTSALDFLAKGGVLMIFIFLCSIAAIVFFIERLIALNTARRQIAQLSKPLREAIESSQYERAMTLCDSHPCALGALAQTALKHQQRTREGIQEAVSDEAKIQFSKLERFIPAIGIIASISPLLGLLGTVTGMIQVFSKLADEYAAGAHANPGMLAGGIWEALLTTAAGLCVAIPAFLLHRFLSSKLDRLWLELESESTQIIDILAPPPEQPKTKTEKPSK
ncbi:MAG: MotA/TolQ/ExbB proton channel family protein [Proteobacteria bacterium]|jgi:biopolymer transport protein ExbB|nr:MotA/TolQ/ExbB proton channel family protein [Pseudomonadota bacterium]